MKVLREEIATDYFWNKMADLLEEAQENGFCFGFTNGNGEVIYWADAESFDFCVAPID